MSSRLSLVATSYVLLCRADSVLLQLRQNTGYMDGHWAIGAAGHLEARETVLEAAQREAREELGIEIALQDLEPLCTLHRTGGQGTDLSERVDFFFRVTTWEGTPVIAEANKAVDVGWFGLDSLPCPMVPHELDVLRKYQSSQIQPIMTFGF